MWSVGQRIVPRLGAHGRPVVRKETGKMRDGWKKPQTIVLFVSVAVAGAVTGAVVGFFAATDLSPVLTGLLAGLLSALLGTAAFVIALRIIEK
jgi:hypothetical protein